MNVSLMSFSKKKNSTATPSSGGSSLNGTLREGCSVIRPVIGFELSRVNFANWNYAYIPDFYRYYYIQDWAWEGGLWWAYMEVDPLASFKAGIGVSTCYVLRARSEKDSSIVDALYPTTVTETLQTTIDDSAWWEKDFTEGSYILGVLGEGNTVGAVNYYVLSPSEMETFKSSLMSNVQSMVGTTEITNELLKALFNPFQYVVSAIWLPIKKQYLPTSSNKPILLGWWDSGATGDTLSEYFWDDTYDFTFNINVPSVTEKYMLAAPYSSYSLFFPPFGLIELDSNILVSNYDDSYVGYPVQCSGKIVVDLITGMGFLQITSYSDVIAYREAQVGIPTQLGQSTQDILGGVQNLIGGIGSIASGAIGMFLGMGGVSEITSGLNGIIDAGKSVVPSASTSGRNGGIGALQYHPYLQIVRRQVVERNPDENGYPLCKTKIISTLSGYIKTMNSDITLPGATDAEQEQIRAFMNGGFFYE